MNKLFVASALLCTLLSAPALAQDYVVGVNGIVCEFCAYGVAKKIRKLPFIDKAQLDKGVRVDIEDQQVFIAVNQGSTLDKKALFKAIEKGGYKPLGIWLLNENVERSELLP